MLTKHELAELLRVHPRTIERLVLAGQLPRGWRVGRQVRWLRDEVISFLDPQHDSHMSGRREQQ